MNWSTLIDHKLLDNARMNVPRPANPIKVMQLGSPTGLYGAERWILALIRHLDPEQVTSIVTVIRDEPGLKAPLCSRAQELGFEAKIFEATGKVNWGAVAQIRQYLREHNIAVLHTHAYKADLMGLLATWGTQCRLVSTPHGWSAQSDFKLRLYEWLNRAAFPFFDAVAPLSQALMDELIDWPGMENKLHLITNGVDIGEIDAVGEVARELMEFKRDGNFVFGYIGQLISRKSLPVLLNAFAQLELPHKKLVLLGEGEQRSELERLADTLRISESVHFIGFRADRLAFLKGFDAFVLPSRQEGIPRCLMEAMAARVPIIASNIPGCRDLVRHDDTGLLFKLDDVADLVSCMRVCIDPTLRERLAVRAREYVLANYSAAAMARAYQRLYGSLLQDGAAVHRKHAVPQSR